MLCNELILYLGYKILRSSKCQSLYRQKFNTFGTKHRLFHNLSLNLAVQCHSITLPMQEANCSVFGSAFTNVCDQNSVIVTRNLVLFALSHHIVIHFSFQGWYQENRHWFWKIAFAEVTDPFDDRINGKMITFTELLGPLSLFGFFFGCFLLLLLFLWFLFPFYKPTNCLIVAFLVWLVLPMSANNIWLY